MHMFKSIELEDKSNPSFVENVENCGKLIRSGSISDEKTQNTDAHSNHNKAKKLIAINKDSISNMNDLILILNDKSRSNDSESLSNYDEKDDVFERELIISKERNKTEISHPKKKDNSLRIFQRLVKDNQFVQKDDSKITTENDLFQEDSLLKQPFQKVCDPKRESNITLEFDKKNDNTFLCISNIHHDFMENSFDDTFKKDFLTVTESKDNEKLVSDSLNDILNNKNEVRFTNQSTSFISPSFFERNKIKIFVCVLLIFISLVFIILIVQYIRSL